MGLLYQLQRRFSALTNNKLITVKEAWSPPNAIWSFFPRRQIRKREILYWDLVSASWTPPISTEDTDIVQENIFYIKRTSKFVLHIDKKNLLLEFVQSSNYAKTYCQRKKNKSSNLHRYKRTSSIRICTTWNMLLTYNTRHAYYKTIDTNRQNIIYQGFFHYLSPIN